VRPVAFWRRPVRTRKTVSARRPIELELKTSKGKVPVSPVLVFRGEQQTVTFSLAAFTLAPPRGSLAPFARQTACVAAPRWHGRPRRSDDLRLAV
jgi:hypothetical protein